MGEQCELQEMTVGAIIAEGLEAEADRMPPSCEAKAEILREQAANYRANVTKLVSVWRPKQT